MKNLIASIVKIAKGSPKPGQPTHQIKINVDKQGIDFLNETTKKLNLSLGEFIRRAFAVYTVLAEAVRKGAKIKVVYPDGKEEPLDIDVMQ